SRAVALLGGSNDTSDTAVTDALNADSAIAAGLDFSYVVFETLKRTQLAGVYHDTVAHEADGILTFDIAVRNHAAGDSTYLGYSEYLANFCIADDDLFHFRREHTFHRILHVVDRVVDDGVKSDFDLLLFGNPFRSS